MSPVSRRNIAEDVEFQRFFAQEDRKREIAPFEDFLSDHNRIINCIAGVMQHWKENNPQVVFWQEEVSDLTMRICALSVSMENSLEGSVWRRHIGGSFQLADLTSSLILARAQIESYLTFFYLYRQPQSEDESIFRFCLHVVHGLRTRQHLATPPPELRQQLEDERQRIDEYIAIIRQNPVFSALSPSWQGQLLPANNPGRAKVKGWEDLISDSRLNTYIFQKSWNLYSNHAHAEYIGLIQMRDFVNNPNKGEWLKKHVLLKSLMLLSCFLKELILVTGTQEYYHQAFSQETIDRVDYWEWHATLPDSTNKE